MVFNVLKNLIAGRKLVYVHIGITHRCPFRCRMCNVWKTADAGSEIPIERYPEVAGKLARLGAAAVSLGGGEPFVRKDLPDIVRSFIAAGVRPRVLTNGITPGPADFQSLIDAGLRDISVSLDTLKPQVQADIYGGQDVWPKLKSNLDWLSNATTGRNLFVLLNTVVSGLNAGELPDLAAFAAALSFHISFVPLELASAPDDDDDFAAYAPDMALSDEQHQTITESFERLIDMKRNGYPVFNSTTFLTLCSAYIRGRKVEWPCRAGQLFLSIDPTGKASFCHAADPFGSVLDSDFEDRFRSAAIQEEALLFRKNCHGCLRPCWVEPTLAVHHPPSALEQIRSIFLRRW